VGEKGLVKKNGEGCGGGGRTYVEGLPDVLRGLSLDHGGHGCACQVKEGL